MVHFHILSLRWSLKDFVKLHLWNYQGKYEKLSYKTPSGTFQSPLNQAQGHSICESELEHWQRNLNTGSVVQIHLTCLHPCLCSSSVSDVCRAGPGGGCLHHCASAPFSGLCSDSPAHKYLPCLPHLGERPSDPLSFLPVAPLNISL